MNQTEQHVPPVAPTSETTPHSELEIQSAKPKVQADSPVIPDELQLQQDLLEKFASVLR